MFYEYAIDPTVLSSWDRARFFLDAFGPSKGRLLAQYPRRWQRMVLDALTCADVEKKRITERLTQLDRRVFSPRTNAAYDGALSWFMNAQAEHGRNAFRAIVTATPCLEDHVLDGASVDERHERWRVDSGRVVPRDPQAYVQALHLLLAASRRVVIIDPYFRADQDNKTRPVVALCQAVFGKATVEIHFADEHRGYEPCMKDAARALPGLLPDGMKVTLHCWKERSGGPRLHNRYLITDVGGVKFGDSIERGDPGQHDHLSILDEPSRLLYWEHYVGASPAFLAAGEPREVSGCARRR